MNPARPPSHGLVRLTLALARLRGDVQEVPYSPQRLVALFIAAGALDGLTGLALGQADTALAHSLVGGSLVLALCWIALRIRGLGQRFVQTATALVACGFLVSLVQLPLAQLFSPAGVEGAATPNAMSGLQTLVRLGLLATLAWQTLVYAHVMRQAMEATFGFALTLVITWVIASVAIEQILFGAT
jgi:hypothetical protein